MYSVHHFCSVTVMSSVMSLLFYSVKAQSIMCGLLFSMGRVLIQCAAVQIVVKIIHKVMNVDSKISWDF